MIAKYAKDLPQGSGNNIANVAIIGGGGQNGKFFVDAILAKGNFTLTAIQRPDSTSTLPDGVKSITADYSGDDDSQLVDALRGQQVLIITIAVTAPPGTVAKISRAAAKAGVSFVFPNFYGVAPAPSLLKDTGFQPMVDNIVNTFSDFTNTSYIFFICGFWYEFSLGGGPDRYGFDFKNRSLTWFDDGNVKINTSTWPQCGRAIANLLSLKILPDDENDTAINLTQFGNKAVRISSFLVSQRDMFESVKRVTGTTDEDWNISHEMSEQRWKDAQAEMQKGNFAAFPKLLYSRTFFPGGEGDYESNGGTHNELLSLPVEDLDEWTNEAIKFSETAEPTKHAKLIGKTSKPFETIVQPNHYL